MGFLAEGGVTALWNRVKANFANKMEMNGTTTIDLKAGNGDKLSSVTIPDATTSAAGAMSAADKAKLDGIEAGATKVTVDSAISATSTNPVQNKAVQAALSSATSAADKAHDAADDAADAASEAQATADDAKELATDAQTRAMSAQSVADGAQATADEAKALAESGADDHKWNTTTLNRQIATTVSCYVPMVLDFTGTDSESGTDAYLMPASASPQDWNSFVIRMSDGTVLAATPSAGDSSTKCATTAFVSAAIANAQVGAAMYQGAASSNDDISGSDYKAGWYWVVATAGTYAGETCEAGDMVFANSDKGDAYSADHFDVVQNNIVEMTASEVEAVCTL